MIPAIGPAGFGNCLKWSGNTFQRTDKEIFYKFMILISIEFLYTVSWPAKHVPVELWNPERSNRPVQSGAVDKENLNGSMNSVDFVRTHEINRCIGSEQYSPSVSFAASTKEQTNLPCVQFHIGHGIMNAESKGILYRVAALTISICFSPLPMKYSSLRPATWNPASYLCSWFWDV